MPSKDTTNIDIFKPCHGADYHACIGCNSYQDFQTFSEGFFLASKALLDRLINVNKSIGEHDDLINPVLYSARHGIELAIKYVLYKLNESDIDTNTAQTHKISELWREFQRVCDFDRRLQIFYSELNNLVMQMDEADPDGQDFRYPTDNEGNPTQEGKVIVDLINARTVIVFLSEQLKELCFLSDKIVRERSLGAYTKELSRVELKRLSEQLPPIGSWKYGDDFQVTKEKWKVEFELSNTAFSRAVDFIKSHREFSGNIMNYHDFMAINEGILSKVMDLAHEVQEHNIAENKKNRLGTSFFDLAGLDKVPKEYELYPKIKRELTREIVADVNTLFYLSRDGYYSEEYEFLFGRNLKNFIASSKEPMGKQIRTQFLHVFEKTNFIRQVVKSLKMIGRLDLCEKYETYIYETNEPGLIVSGSGSYIVPEVTNE